ncbi:MAG: lipopolysaccharide heptosyltransferase family protein [Bacteroidetes bacterium]|nr:MAG: lipopolysaccharide heptosyltransferase family protein [Bacteroidota bacterium]
MTKKENFIRRKIKKFVSLNRIPIVITKPEDVFHLPDNSKILILRQDRIGDLLISIPTIRSLRTKFPNAKIDLVLSRRNHGISNSVRKYVDKIWIYDKEIISMCRLVRQIRKENYSVIVDFLTKPSLSSSYLIKYSQCPIVLGFDKENRNSYTHVIETANKGNLHIVQKTAELMNAFGIETSNLNLSLEYQITDDDRRKVESELGEKLKKRIGINLSGSSKSKYWGINNYIDCIKRIKLQFNDIEVYIFTTLIYKPVALKIMKETGAKLAKITNSIHEYACQLSTCDIIITPYKSAVHFAAACGIPCIILYNRKSEDDATNFWSSYKSPYIELTTASGNLSNISVDDVVNAFNKLINK